MVQHEPHCRMPSSFWVIAVNILSSETLFIGTWPQISDTYASATWTVEYHCMPPFYCRQTWKLSFQAFKNRTTHVVIPDHCMQALLGLHNYTALGWFSSHTFQFESSTVWSSPVIDGVWQLVVHSTAYTQMSFFYSLSQRTSILHWNCE